jgi:hypothetical protein
MLDLFLLGRVLYHLGKWGKIFNLNFHIPNYCVSQFAINSTNFEIIYLLTIVFLISHHESHFIYHLKNPLVIQEVYHLLKLSYFEPLNLIY